MYAIRSYYAWSKGESQLVGFLLQSGDHLLDLGSVCMKKILKQHTFFRCIGMEWKGVPANGDVIDGLQLFNTPGNEITPGSDIIRKQFQYWFLQHCLFLLWFHAAWPAIDDPAATLAVQNEPGIDKTGIVFGTNGCRSVAQITA